MKILIFNWRDITHSWSGGSEKYIHELAREWVQMGHTVQLICGGYPGALPCEVIDGVVIHRLGTTYTVYFMLPFYYWLRVRREKFDVMIENAYGVAFFTPLYTRLPKVLFIHHDHMLAWQTEWPRLIASIGIWIENHVVPRIYKNIVVVTPAKKHKETLLQQGYRKVFAISPGSKKVRSQYPKSTNPTILYLGRLRKYKRVDLLLKVFKKLTTKIKRARLIIAGTGHDASRIRFLVQKMDLQKHVELKGYVSEAEKEFLLQSTWVVAIPSQIEGWGLVALESAASGSPTVGFNVPGINESIRNGFSGFVVKTKDDFNEALITLLTNSRVRQRLANNAQSWAKKFSWNKTAKAWISVLREARNNNSTYSQDYYSSFWRGSGRRSFHPTYTLRAWYISKRLLPKTVLDVGCGTGLLVRLLRQQGMKAWGVDISQAALESATGQERRFLTQGDMLALKARDKSYDMVACVDVLEHIKPSDLPQAVTECARVAKKYIFFDITCLEDLLFIHTDKTHVSKLYSWQWRHMLESQLGVKWQVFRPYLIPFIHHGTFVAKRLS